METGIFVSCTSESNQNVVSFSYTQRHFHSLPQLLMEKRCSSVLVAEKHKYHENKQQMRIKFLVLSTL